MSEPSAGRAFRLHHHRLVVDGWVTADGQAVTVDDPEYGLTSAADSITDLVRGYGGGHIEWLPLTAQHTAPPQQQGAPR
ncbi:hypothetical protein OG742_37285 [Streptomyces sp. NBC_00828]|uniref:hypothetical protein n=1 Tax=Streptomyces sp. NBC_00828 TaxID=2903678 RepID=UPI0038664D9D